MPAIMTQVGPRHRFSKAVKPGVLRFILEVLVLDRQFTGTTMLSTMQSLEPSCGHCFHLVTQCIRGGTLCEFECQLCAIIQHLTLFCDACSRGMQLIRQKPAAATNGTAGETILRCVQHAGDLVYVPDGWGHGVLNLEVSVGSPNHCVHF